MHRIVPLLLLVVVSTGTLGGSACGAEPRKEELSGPEIVRRAINAESKIYDVASLKVISTSDSTLTPRYIEQIKAAGGSPRPESRVEVEFVFDGRRARQLYEIEGVMANTEVWNGAERLVHRSASAGETESYLWTDSFINGFNGHLPWVHFAARRFWWTPLEQTSTGKASPEKYTLVGDEQYQGTRCFHCQSVGLLCRLYIGVDDGLLRGLIQYDLPTEAEELALLNRLTKRTFESVQEVAHYVATLPAFEQSRLEAEHDRERFAGPRGRYEIRLEDYREIAPGLRIPFQISLLQFGVDGTEVFAKSEARTKIVTALVNPPLAEDTFQIEIPTGAQVEDGRGGLWPPLSYTYQKDFSPEQWKAITAPREQDLAKARREQEKRRARLGKSVPDFGEGKWRNCEELTMADLRGKLVLLEFMADWCGACQRHYPTVAWLHEERDPDLVVIGVHTAGSEAAAVDKFVAQTNIAYPVYEDAPGRRGSMGELCDWFQFNSVPQSVLVDREGKVAVVGSLEDVLLKVHELSTEPASP